MYWAYYSIWVCMPVTHDDIILKNFNFHVWFLVYQNVFSKRIWMVYSQITHEGNHWDLYWLRKIFVACKYGERIKSIVCYITVRIDTRRDFLQKISTASQLGYESYLKSALVNPIWQVFPWAFLHSHCNNFLLMSVHVMSHAKNKH